MYLHIKCLWADELPRLRPVRAERLIWCRNQFSLQQHRHHHHSSSTVGYRRPQTLNGDQPQQPGESSIRQSTGVSHCTVAGVHCLELQIQAKLSRQHHSWSNFKPKKKDVAGSGTQKQTILCHFSHCCGWIHIHLFQGLNHPTMITNCRMLSNKTTHPIKGFSEYYFYINKPLWHDRVVSPWFTTLDFHFYYSCSNGAWFSPLHRNVQ